MPTLSQVCHVDVPLGSTFQYKFVILNENDGGQYWQDGENRECDIPMDPAHKVRFRDSLRLITLNTKPD